MDDLASAPTATTSQQENDITSRVGDITLETKSLSNCNENQEQVSTSVVKNDSKDGILEGEEGELDYEEDEGETLDTNKQETPKKTKETSDIEEGELEDGEVNSDGEEGEILSDKDEVVTKKKTDKEDGEINEDDLEDGEVRDQSDSYSSNPGRGIPRKLCRYFVSGSCTWGVSCRFLHPGINDKGAYQMLPQPGQYPVPYVRPAQPTSFPAVETTPSTPALIPEYDQPEDLDTDPTTDKKPVIPEKETAWERGIRLAKENKKAAMRRKEEDKEFEQKRMMLSISVDVEEEDGNKENQLKRKDLRDRMKKDIDSTDRTRGGAASRFRDTGDRYSYKDKDKKRNRTRRSISSSPERRKYDRRRENRESTKQSSDLDKKKDKDRAPKPKSNDSIKKKDNTIPVSTTKEQETKDVKPENKTKTSSGSETEDKTKTKGGFVGVSNDRLASDEWHDPWQRTTSPKRRSPRRRSTTSSYSSRSRSSSSSSGSSRSSPSRSRTPSSTGSESRSSSRSISRSPSRSRSRTPSETSSRSRSRSATPSSESDRSSTSSHASNRKEENASKPSSVRNRSISHSQSDSETPSESESESDRSRSSPSPVLTKPPSPTRSPGGRGIRSPPEPVKEREFKEKKPRAEHDSREERGDKYRQQPMIGWDRREQQQRWEDPYGRGNRDSRGNKDREPNQRRRRSPPTRRDGEQRRHFEEAAPHSQRDNMDHSRPLSPPRSRDYSRRDDRSSSSNGTSNNTKSSNRSSNVPSNESWAAERRKRQQIPLSSGSVRYAGHKDIKLTLNKSVGKAQPPSQSSRSHSPTRQVEASSSSTGHKDNESKKRYGRQVEPEAPQRHSSPRDDVTSSKPIKRAADSVLTPRPVDAPSNKRPSDDSSKNRVEPNRPLKRSADSAPTTKRTTPENVPIKPQPRDQPEPADSKQGHMSNSSRREELLRELKAVEDAIARKRARIE